MKQKKIFLTIILFAVLFIYITNINTIPKNIILFQNEQYEFSILKCFDITGENVSIGESFWNKIATIKSNFVGDTKLKLTAAGIKVKDITVSVIPTTSVIPCGDAVGVKLYSEGVLVVGKGAIECVDSGTYEPYNKTKIDVGDIILKIDNKEIENISELITAVNATGGRVTEITYKRDNTIYTENIVPVKSMDDGKYKLGLWVRDGAMGVGTLTFYIPEGKIYGALGHGISDIDVRKLLEVESGILNTASIISISKGQKSMPGELRGTLNSNVVLGDVKINTLFGIYGIYNEGNNLLRGREAIPVAGRSEIKVGRATILCTVEGNKPIEYEIEIQRINDIFSNDTKSMIIKVLDENLLEKTGGIVQGMSGSPIIQNGKFIGAVTHVFVNDPTRGYAVFGDLMIKEANNISN